MIAKCDDCGYKGQMTDDWSFTLNPVKRFCPTCSENSFKKFEAAKRRRLNWHKSLGSMFGD